MGNCEPKQRKSGRHDLGGSAARAQIIERTAEHEEEDSEEYVGRAADRRIQQRRMQDNQEGRDAGGDERQSDVAERQEG